MTRVDIFLKEFDEEAAITRKMLSRVPDDKYDWKPHRKSMSVRELATHIAELPGWVKLGFTTEGLDFAANPYQQEAIGNTKELLEYFEKTFADSRQYLADADDEILDIPWVLRNGEQIYDEGTKGGTVRASLSQTIHHRAQLGVFLRLLNVPIPGSYGPSADELGL
ncbi:DinB family protein [Pinibacter soli]|uniref:DinB family protein n=1 Tax=Pinibacter soli TaxID=3044211 RepID=A0ABT6R9T1_9BACT|nr:DinB family protein [Pinibacter soli]MDI3319317.1 DinB family protein [Pinibacter soli]